MELEVKQNFQKQFELMQEQFKEEIKKTKKESKLLGKKEDIMLFTGGSEYEIQNLA